ncbi:MULTISPECIES: hypothetical protein [Cyanophyceae]|uniref:hypothetical protein n=1 Tax=Cyanophyceae TaxID=3028117 RepID=UPI0016869C95|nr:MULTISPECIES: hypothetical protein [Cyanophyceae]MBD1916660.1 hypothetical protein [Phormidium sp. FACHB-77]MBD2030017.1 hypothetical protein [Phormidium sp. FACHB-322]MBD2053228.1 hypothetical protein [Leptolyngbya sp. FACHB-60]
MLLWDWAIPAVDAVQVVPRIYTTDDGGQTACYLAILQAQDEEYLIKAYARNTDPELEILQHRIYQFNQNRDGSLAVFC